MMRTVAGTFFPATEATRISVPRPVEAATRASGSGSELASTGGSGVFSAPAVAAGGLSGGGSGGAEPQPTVVASNNEDTIAARCIHASRVFKLLNAGAERLQRPDR
jgi:hypothetical protein